MASRTDIANDMYQTAPTREAATAFLKGLKDGMLRALADLNHLDTEGSPAALRRLLIADRDFIGA
jgi:hypothetical protein